MPQCDRGHVCQLPNGLAGRGADSDEPFQQGARKQDIFAGNAAVSARADHRHPGILFDLLSYRVEIYHRTDQDSIGSSAMLHGNRAIGSSQDERFVLDCR